ncbi:uncharacterized protein F4822DRAFT_386454 [Hypoxylon trugodes]|uniref:uncharacterized protein n=1 Tax=Hypoxylon trugodes TaxID=326681 RepID=UPI00219BCCDC|nr:uncharacterized protein F4822DRAFT_386454 [Hypoxylon trugodes]KAI1393942.1 hypothetical protein F4822DRAFT_386454 [Hypoxylon trugodes]
MKFLFEYVRTYHIIVSRVWDFLLFFLLFLIIWLYVMWDMRASMGLAIAWCSGKNVYAVMVVLESFGAAILYVCTLTPIRSMSTSHRG